MIPSVNASPSTSQLASNPARGLDVERDGITLTQGLEQWAQACLALRVCIVAGGDVGGVRLTAKHGPVRTAWLDALSQLAPPELTRVVPANITDDRLTGAIDLAATLAAGKRVDEPGVLSGLGRDGVAILQGFDRVTAETRGLVAQAWDQARFLLVAIDESESDDPEVAAALRLKPNAIDDRLGLWVTLDCVSLSDCGLSHSPDRADSIGLRSEADNWDAVRAGYGAVAVSDESLSEVCRIAAMLGVHSLRAVMATVAAARAVAAIEGRADVSPEDIATVLPLTLLPRATQMPALDEATDEDDVPDEPPPSSDEDNAEDPETREQNNGPLDDQVIDAARAVLPPDLLAALAAAAQASAPGASGASGAVRKGGRKGRRFGARQGAPRGDRKLNLIETLRAAAPWQALRAKALASRPGGLPQGIRVHVRKSDFRVYRQKERAETLAVFVVDASGSSAVQRFGEAKGAIELLLGESYARRDHVALVAVRGQVAELLLPSTRSLTRAKRVLSSLPGGGGTPLASGIDAGLEVAKAAAHRGQSPMIVLLTDGQANVARDGSHGRKQASADAIDAARAVQQSGLPAVVLDTSNRPQVRAADIAVAMGARYMPLPRADAEALARTVSTVADEARSERVV